MRKAVIIVWLLSFSTGFAVSAQQKMISGAVRDEHTQEGIPFAAVYFPGASTGTSTNDSGNYSFVLSHYPADSLSVRVIGYQTMTLRVNKSLDRQTIDFLLNRKDLALKEFVIHGGADPALILLHKIIRHKPDNNENRLRNYKYRVYNKLEVDLDKINKNKFIHTKLFKPFAFIFDNIDSTSEAKPFLPVYLTETLSDYYYQGSPRKDKELIIASRRSGIKNESLTQFLGSMYQQVNVYDNFIPVFGKEFASPISDFATAYYDYKIIDTQFIDHRKCFRMSFEPKRKGENTFFGDFWVNDTTFAIQKMSMQVSRDANINFVQRVSLVQEYTPLNDTLWFLTKNKFIADFITGGKKSMGLIGRKTTLFTRIAVNDTAAADIFKEKQYSGNNIYILPGATDKKDSFWVAHRPEELSRNENAVYSMMDTLQKMPLFREYSNTIRFIATGKKVFGPLEFGPYFYLFNINSLEKFRVRLGVGTTSQFSKHIYLNGYLAYGFGDRKFKGRIAGLWFLQKDPQREYLFASYTHDIDNGAIHHRDAIGVDNLFALAIRKPGIVQKFVMVDEKRLEYYKEWGSGFGQMLSLVNTEYDPYAPLPVKKYFQVQNGPGGRALNDMQAGIELRYAYREKFFDRNNYYRVSLGSKYPIVAVNYAMGLKGVLHSDYHYQKTGLSISGRIKIPPLGKLHYNIYGEKIFGTLPYLLLEIHPGNELYYYNKYAFNTMNRYEFISDEYAGFNIEHDIGGGIFNYIPYVRKWKLRQFWTAKGVMGRLSEANKVMNLHNGYSFRTLDNNPYMELGTGVENILHLIRIDFIWRVTPLSMPAGRHDNGFGIFGSLKLQF